MFCSLTVSFSCGLPITYIYLKSDVINMTWAWNNEKIWVPDSQSHQIPANCFLGFSGSTQSMTSVVFCIYIFLIWIAELSAVISEAIQHLSLTSPSQITRNRGLEKGVDRMQRVEFFFLSFHSTITFLAVYGFYEKILKRLTYTQSTKRNLEVGMKSLEGTNLVPRVSHLTA